MDIKDIIAFYILPVILIFGIFVIVCQWIIYIKAGQPGWATIVPFYTIIIRLKVADKPVSWVFWFIPFYFFYALIYILDIISIKVPMLKWESGVLLFLFVLSAITYLVFYIIVTNAISKNFGKKAGFTVGMLLLAPLFYGILAFGSSTYLGPGGVASSENDYTIPQPNN